MAGSRDGLLTCLKKRDQLNDRNVNAQAMIAEGTKFLEAGNDTDAMEFFAKADYREGLERILDQSVEEGDAFAAKSAGRRLGRVLSREQWARLGNGALERGKYRFALEAFTEAGEEEKREHVRRIIGEPTPE